MCSSREIYRKGRGIAWKRFFTAKYKMDDVKGLRSAKERVFEALKVFSKCSNDAGIAVEIKTVHLQRIHGQFDPEVVEDVEILIGLARDEGIDVIYVMP